MVPAPRPAPKTVQINERYKHLSFTSMSSYCRHSSDTYKRLDDRISLMRLNARFLAACYNSTARPRPMDMRSADLRAVFNDLQKQIKGLEDMLKAMQTVLWMATSASGDIELKDGRWRHYLNGRPKQS